MIDMILELAIFVRDSKRSGVLCHGFHFLRREDREMRKIGGQEGHV